MKTKLFFLLLTCIFYMSLNGQVNNIIDDNAIQVHTVSAADINADGYMDVLAASWEDDIVAWHENDGFGNFTKSIITDQADAHHACAADFDNDGDLDVVYDSVINSTLAWQENTDGLGGFGAPNVIPTSYEGLHHVFPADIDNDGDMDVFAAYFISQKVAWYENTNGLGAFTIEHTIPANAESTFVIHAADLDGDGDVDVISGSDEGSLFWYKNMDGLGTFEIQSPISLGSLTIYAISASDMDEDGDIDVLASINGSTLLVLFENDGLGNFNMLREIPTPNWCTWIHPVDIDDDGDKDILCAEYGNNTITLYINDGDENFTKTIVTGGALGAVCAVATHLDDNSYIDVVSGWSEASKVVWTEDILGVDENTLSDFFVYPNPTTGILNIESETIITQIAIYNLLGQLVLSNTNQNTIDISSVEQGVYFIKVMDENGNIGTQKVVKR